MQASIGEAARKGDLKRLSECVFNRQVDINTVDEHGLTPLMHAVAGGHVAAARLLLTRANVNQKGPTGADALSTAVAAGGDPEMLRWLIKAGADIVQSRALAEAAHLDQTATVQLFVEHGIDILLQSYSRDTLFNAAESDSVKVLRLLVEDYGFDVNAPHLSDQFGSALKIAARSGRFDAVHAVRYLLGRSVSEDLRQQALTEATHSGHAEVMQALIDAGADPHAVDGNGRPLLTWAVRTGHIETAKVLIDAGADVNDCDQRHDTALMYAAHRKSPAMARLLMEHGADLHATNNEGATVLMHAALNGRVATACYLMDQGADIHAVAPHAEDGRSALEVALRRDYLDLVELLQQRGATLPQQLNDHAPASADPWHYLKVMETALLTGEPVGVVASHLSDSPESATLLGGHGGAGSTARTLGSLS